MIRDRNTNSLCVFHERQYNVAQDSTEIPCKHDFGPESTVAVFKQRVGSPSSSKKSVHLCEILPFSIALYSKCDM